MGYGEIIGGGPAARYTVRLDYGEAIKASTLAALNEQLVKVTNELSAAQSRLATAESNAAAERTAVSDAINTFIAAGGTGNLTNNAVQAALQFLEQSRKAVIAAQRLTVPERLKVDALTITKAQIVDYIARWNAAVTIQTKDCWCADYTESGSGYVATIDIDGESGLTLIAPGCRAWQGGDGTISLTRKAEAVAELNARLMRAEEELVSANSALATAIGVEESARSDLDAAQASYKAAPTELRVAKADEVAYALKFWHDCMAKTGQARVRQSRAQNRVDDVSVQLADWEAKPASEMPLAGDGVMFATDVMSPAQFFWNLAAFPAWQKFRPTYRWGTLTGVNYENDTADVALTAATSSQQSLGINQTNALTAVPIEYMTCNSQIFMVDDRVVVQFTGQDWTQPKVIGFLDNPKPCGWECIYLASSYPYVFAPLLASQVLAIFTGTATVEAKINGGAWVALTINPAFTTATSKRWEYSYPMPGRPVDNPATAVITLIVDTDGIASPATLGGLPAHIAVGNSPHWPPGEDRERVVTELRVKLGAALAFNAAIADTGWSSETIYRTGLCKVAGGIDLVTLPSNGPSLPVGPLSYTLTGRA